MRFRTIQHQIHMLLTRRQTFLDSEAGCPYESRFKSRNNHLLMSLFHDRLLLSTDVPPRKHPFVRILGASAGPEWCDNTTMFVCIERLLDLLKR